MKWGSGVDVSLTPNVDKAGAELMLSEELENLRRQGLEMWQANYPALHKEPEALVGHQLQVMRWGPTQQGGPFARTWKSSARPGTYS